MEKDLKELSRELFLTISQLVPVTGYLSVDAEELLQMELDERGITMPPKEVIKLFREQSAKAKEAGRKKVKWRCGRTRFVGKKDPRKGYCLGRNE